MKITIDNKEINVKDSKKNIVEIAEDHGIAIVAPCFRNKRKGGCCKACIIEIDGAKKFACGTKPKDGMNIIYKRTDLKELRDKAIQEYLKVLNENKSSSCGCNSNLDSQFETADEENTCCGSNAECCG